MPSVRRQSAVSIVSCAPIEDISPGGGVAWWQVSCTRINKSAVPQTRGTLHRAAAPHSCTAPLHFAPRLFLPRLQRKIIWCVHWHWPPANAFINWLHCTQWTGISQYTSHNTTATRSSKVTSWQAEPNSFYARALAIRINFHWAFLYYLTLTNLLYLSNTENKLFSYIFT